MRKVGGGDAFSLDERRLLESFRALPPGEIRGTVLRYLDEIRKLIEPPQRPRLVLVNKGNLHDKQSIPG